jgi:hypothetical protein
MAKVKAESPLALQEVVKLMQQDPKLKLYVGGTPKHEPVP